MNIIKLQVKNFEITPLEKQYVVENQVNEFAIEFEFDDSWDFETKYVVFDNEETTYKRPIINNQVIIPSELLNGRTTIQIYGQNVEDGEIVKRKPSYKYSFSILNSLSTDGQEESDLPTPSQWELYISQIEELCNDLQDQFDDLKEDCETKCDDVIERLGQDEQDIQTNTDNIRANAEAIDKLNTDLLDYSLITETGNKISMSINPQTYVITLSLKDKNDNVLSTQSVDLPLETMIVSASYSNGVLTFTLKNGQTLQVPIGDLVSGLVSTDTFNQAVQGLSNRITTIENDYLKSTDKTELQNQITQNAHDIDNIQEEQLTQNADIEELQQENERLSRIVEGLPTKQASGTSFVLNDMVKANIKEYQLKGDTIQNGTPTPSDPIPVEVVTGNQEINVFGKNLMPENKNLNQGYLGDVGNIAPSNNSVTILNYINVAPSTNYYISFNATKGELRGIAFYDINKRFVSRSTILTLPITTPSNCYYIRIYFYNSDGLSTSEFNSVITNIQVEQGNSQTSFEKYKTPQIKTISLGNIELCKIGDYQDRIYKSNDKWYLEKNIGKVVLNGSENWFASDAINNHYRYILAIPDCNLTNYNIINCYSNAFKGVSRFNLQNNNDITVVNTGLQVLVDDYSTLSSFKTWLSSNNVYVYYLLSTPIDTEITDSTLISQLEDILNIILNENNTIIINGNLPSDTLVIGYADIAKLIASLSSQDNRSVEENIRKVEEEPVETKEER